MTEKKRNSGRLSDLPPVFQHVPKPPPIVTRAPESPTLDDIERFLNEMLQKPHSHGLTQAPRQTGKTMAMQEWQKRIMQQLRNADMRYIEHEAYYGQRYYDGRGRVPLEERTRYQNATPESFISPMLTSRIAHWCHTDERVDRFWSMLTSRVQAGLDDYIVGGVLQALAYLLNQWDDTTGHAAERAKERATGLSFAARNVVSAYEDALARGDLAYMRETIEELDAATHDIEES